MKTILFIRHAESEANAGLATNSDSTIVLTTDGRQQALQLTKSISIDPDLIICSKYIRTTQTAAPLLLKYPSVPLKRLPLHEFTYLSPEHCAGTTNQQRKSWVSAYWEACSPSVPTPCNSAYA